MKIEIIKSAHLRNEEHFQFQTDFKSLVDISNPDSLNIKEVYDLYTPLYNNEKEALNLMRKSALTEDIAQSDNVRDQTFHGFNDTIKLGKKHFKQSISDAATKIDIALKHYVNITSKSYDEKTASINSLITELTNKYSSEISTIIGAKEWLAELKSNNEAFDKLKKTRYSEEANKTLLRMSKVRVEIDIAYKNIVERVNALAVVNGDTDYLSFINELNKRIDSYSNVLAQRKGRGIKDTNSVENKKD